jgi:xanthine dehydrogenase YagR molybdenum-binding subunit
MEASRVDALLKVTGRARYGADRTLPGMLYGHVLLSTVANGVIRDVDTTGARKVPGVVAVFSPLDPLELRPTSTPMFGDTWVPMRGTDVDFYGQPVGLVVADTFEHARDAALAVAITYDERPAVTSLADGLATAEELPDRAHTYLEPGVESIVDALAASPVVVQGTYATATQNHAAIEPHSAVATWDDGELTVYSGTQATDLQALELAIALGVDQARVHAVNPFVGGAFGGKGRTSVAGFLAAAAARVLERPVKVVLTREQVFTATANRAATVQHVAIGASEDGALLALRHDAWCATPMDRSFVETAANNTKDYYAVPNLATTQKIVPLNLPHTTYMRAPGMAPGSFALESAMDELAVALRMDPVELRLKNDSTAPLGSDLLWSSKHLDECYQHGAERFGWSRRLPHGREDGDWLVGMGTATATFPAHRFPATVRVALRDNDTAIVAASGADPGTGLLTVLSTVAAESLDVPRSRVVAALGDSAFPAGGVSGGSSGTASAGSAVMIAAARVVDDLLALASSAGAPFDGLDALYTDGRVLASGRSMTFGEVLRATGRGELSAEGASAAGEERTKHSFSSFGAQFVEVRVHRWTREVRVSRMLGVFDAGRIINPVAARGQMMGGMIWGVSSALHEELVIEANGRPANADLAGYLVPVNADIPDVDVVFLEYPDTLHNSVGARGIGELGIVGMAAAVANAVHNATGIRVRHIPITLADLLER